MKHVTRLVFLLILMLAGSGWYFRDQFRPILSQHAPALARLIETEAKPAPQAAANASRRAPAAIPVVAAEVEQKDVPVAFDAVGTVQAIASIAVRPRIDSQIVDVNVKEGAEVKEGDLLFSLDARMLKAQIAQVEAQIQRDEAQLAQARKDLARLEGLVAQKVTTEVARDTQITTVKVAEAALAADIANRDNLNAQLSFTEIRAPVTGRLGSIAAKSGAIVRQADTSPLATVNQLNPIFVVFALPQARLGELQTAMQNGMPTVEVNTSRGTVNGVVAFIENQVDTTTGTINVKARMDNSSEALWPGSFVPVRIVLRMQPSAVAVPAGAVQLGQRGAYVFVIDDANKARVRPVTVARTVDGQSVIGTGVKPGERVVVDGILRLVDGATVSTKDSRTADEKPAGEPKRPAS